MSPSRRTRIALGATAIAALVAIPAGASAQITACTTAKQFGMTSLFPTLSANSQPNAIVLGPDGNFWFTEQASNSIGRITPAGVVTEYPIPTPNSFPSDITVGPDNNLWFTEWGGRKVGRITTGGTLTEFNLPRGQSGAGPIASGPDGNLYVGVGSANLVKMTTAGASSLVPLSIGSASALDILSGPGGLLWVAQAGTNGYGLATVTTSGTVTNIATPAGSQPFTLTQGPDGNVWYTDKSSSAITKVVPASAAGANPAFTRFWKAVANSGAMGWTTVGSKMWFVESAGQIASVSTNGIITEYPWTNASAFNRWSFGTIDPITNDASGNLWVAQNQCNVIGVARSSGTVGMWATSRPSTMVLGRTYSMRVRSSNTGTAKISVTNGTKRTTVLNAPVKKGTNTIRVTLPTNLNRALVGKSTLAINGVVSGLITPGWSAPVTVRTPPRGRR